MVSQASRPIWQSYLALVLGLMVVPWAAIFIRLAAAPALVTGAYRLTLASLILTPLVLWHSHAALPRLDRRDWLLMAVSGVCLGLHFATWISSLEYTSVASSVVLVTTSPFFVGLGSHFLLRERVSSEMFVGVVLAILGGAIIGWGDFSASGQALWGDVLALTGALMASAYFLIGRNLRRHLSLLAYVTPTYWMAALVLMAAALLSRQKLTGYPARSYLFFGLLAIGPQVIGHSSLNWALRYLSPTFVTATVLAEPIGSTILAYLILHEAVSLPKAIGGGIILAGIYICARAETRPQPSAQISIGGGQP